VTAADERHRVTTFELFFDLVYVFAVTQVTAYMAHEHSGRGVIEGLLLLWLLWWTWAAYSWLGNQARADVGLTRAVMAFAMAAVFVVALTIPEAWHDLAGGLDGPVVLVCAYALVRALHLVAYAFAAAGDAGLRRQLVVTIAPMGSGVALLLAAALAGGDAQLALFAAGLGVDWVGTYVTSRDGEWRIHSPTHWSERYGLFVILAIGESIVAVGVGASQLPVSGPLLAGAALGIALSVFLWWLYFDVASMAAEHVLAALPERARVRMAVEAYTYLHLPLVVGIVLTALGIEEVLAHVDEGEALGHFAALALHGGLALYLLSHVAIKRRLHGYVSRARVLAAVAVAAATPLSAALAPLPALLLATVVLGCLVAFEAVRYGVVRDELRQARV
jgi:low temperature requirement protein LtrA